MWARRIKTNACAYVLGVFGAHYNEEIIMRKDSNALYLVKFYLESSAGLEH